MANHTEKQWLTAATTAFKKATGLPATIEKGRLRLANTRLLTPLIKNTLRPAALGQILLQLKQIKQLGIVVTQQMTPPLAETFKKNNIPFIDTAGNAYIKTKTTLIYVVGRKAPTPLVHDKPVRAFREKGLRIIFYLLNENTLHDLTYRAIATDTGVALGTVSNVMQDLEQLGFLHKTTAGKIQLENKRNLIDRWVDAYSIELRPTLMPQRYTPLQADWWKKLSLKEWEVLGLWLGGDAGAATLTDYFHSDNIVLYGRKHFKQAAKLIKPAKDERGTIEWLDDFWLPGATLGKTTIRTCPPLIIYADLVTTGDARQLDAATLIREKYLADD